MNKSMSMKLVAAMTLSLSAGAAQAAIADIAQNGGFETGNFDGWTQFINTGTQTIVSENSTFPPTGSFSARLDVNGTTSLKNANLQAGILTNGQEVTVKFDARADLATGGQLNLLLFSEFSGGGANLVLNQVLFPGSVWQEYSFVTNMAATGDVGGGFTVEFNPVCGAGGCNPASTVWIDNLEVLADVNAVPVPAAVWLFGSGLVGLIGIARRKKSV